MSVSKTAPLFGAVRVRQGGVYTLITRIHPFTVAYKIYRNFKILWKDIACVQKITNDLLVVYQMLIVLCEVLD